MRLFAAALLLALASSASATADEAQLQFKGPNTLTVQCVRGCATQKVYLPHRFPALPVGVEGREIELRFRAPGYRSDDRVVTVKPGTVRVDVQLVRL